MIISVYINILYIWMCMCMLILCGPESLVHFWEQQLVVYYQSLLLSFYKVASQILIWRLWFEKTKMASGIVLINREGCKLKNLAVILYRDWIASDMNFMVIFKLTTIFETCWCSVRVCLCACVRACIYTGVCVWLVPLLECRNLFFRSFCCSWVWCRSWLASASYWHIIPQWLTTVYLYSSSPQWQILMM